MEDSEEILSHYLQPSRIIFNMSLRCVPAMAVRPALALFGDAKQAMGEGKSGPVETGLTGRVATALVHGVS